MEQVYLNFNLPVDSNSTQTFFKVVQDLLQRGVKKVFLLISSPGGNVDAGISIYNFLKGLPIEINTHNYGSCDSIAALVFCAGKKRYTVNHSRFLIHGIGLTLEKERLDENKLKEIIGSIKNQRETISKIIAQECYKENKDVEKNMLDGIILNSEEAVKYGLATDIKDELVPEGQTVINIG